MITSHLHVMSIQLLPGRSTPTASLSSGANSDYSTANSIAIVDEVEPPTPAYIPPSNDTPSIQFSYVQSAGLLQYTQLHRHSLAEIPNSEYRTAASTTIVEPPMPAYFPPSNDSILPIQSSSSDAILLEYMRLHRHSEIPLPSSSRQREYTLQHRHSELSLPSRSTQPEHTLPQRSQFSLPSNCGGWAGLAKIVVCVGGLFATAVTIACCYCHDCCCCCPSCCDCCCEC